MQRSCPAISLNGVSVEFPIYDMDRSFRSLLLKARVGGAIHTDERQRTTVKSLLNLTFDVAPGDRLAVLGPNGAGKSTLLKVMAGAYAPSSGTVEIRGRVSTLLSLGLGLDMDETAYENIFICGLLLGLSPHEIKEITPEIEEFCELGDYMHLPIRTYSTGMLIRLSFAIATSVRPDILLVDEVIGAGDARFAAKAERRIKQLMAKANVLVLASHSNETLRTFCSKGVFLLNGELQFFGPIEGAIEAYDRWVNDHSVA